MTVIEPEGGLNAEEMAQVEYVTAAAEPGSSLLKIAAGLGGAFIIYRLYLQRRLREQMRDNEAATPEQLAVNIQRIYGTFAPTWASMAIPLLVGGYRIGLEQSPLTMNHDFLLNLADSYAYSLGNHLNEISAQAVVSGYQAQINRKMGRKIALANVIDAFGAPPRAIKSLVNVWTGKDDAKLSDAVLPNVKRLRAQQIVNSAINQRADVMGEQEAWNAKEQAKQVSWLYAQQKGLIPPGATRVWETADDERVCPFCGPLHKAEIPVSERFVVEGKGKFWSPPLHPRCRCEVKIKLNLTDKLLQDAFFFSTDKGWLSQVEDSVDPGVVMKADDEPWEDQPRARDGRWTRGPNTQANRGAFRRARFAEPEVDVDTALANARINQADRAGRQDRAALADAALDRLLDLTSTPDLTEPNLVDPSLTESSLRETNLVVPPSLVSDSNSLVDSTANFSDRTKRLLDDRQRMRMAGTLADARAQMIDDIANFKGETITGEVEVRRAEDIDPVTVARARKIPQGYARLEQPVYAAWIPGGYSFGSNNNITVSDSIFDIGGTEFHGDLGVLADRMRQMTREQDDDFIASFSEQYDDGLTEHYTDNEARQMGYPPGSFKDYTGPLAMAIEWERERQANPDLVDMPSMPFEVPIYAYLYTVPETGEKIFVDPFDAQTEAEYAMFEDAEMLEVGSDSVTMDDLDAWAGIREYVENTTPKFIEIDTVPYDALVDHDNGYDTVMTRGAYEYSFAVRMGVDGTEYSGFRLIPVDDDE